jgi:two-component system OmpR family response regulator
MKPLRRVLCVDDEDDILEVVQLCLEMVAGLEVIACHGGREALEQIPAIRPDLILLDVMMPEMDGPETLLQLQKSAIGKDIPIVFMTARVRSTETEEYMRLGAAGVVAKPFDPSTLPLDIERIWRSIHEQPGQHPATLASEPRPHG